MANDRNNLVKIKSFNFFLRIIKLYRFLCRERREYVLSKQILKSGTSIGANVEEADGAQSKKDFLSKMSIAYKEARETDYWLRLLKESQYIHKFEFDSIYNDLQVILRIKSKIQITTKKKLNLK